MKMKNILFFGLMVVASAYLLAGTAPSEFMIGKKSDFITTLYNLGQGGVMMGIGGFVVSKAEYKNLGQILMFFGVLGCSVISVINAIDFFQFTNDWKSYAYIYAIHVFLMEMMTKQMNK